MIILLLKAIRKSLVPDSRRGRPSSRRHCRSPDRGRWCRGLPRGAAGRWTGEGTRARELQQTSQVNPEEKNIKNQAYTFIRSGYGTDPRSSGHHGSGTMLNRRSQKSEWTFCDIKFLWMSIHRNYHRNQNVINSLSATFASPKAKQTTSVFVCCTHCVSNTFRDTNV